MGNHRERLKTSIGYELVTSLHQLCTVDPGATPLASVRRPKVINQAYPDHCQVPSSSEDKCVRFGFKKRFSGFNLSRASEHVSLERWLGLAWAKRRH
eukprot:4921729-Amphidinium_carterae.1